MFHNVLQGKLTIFGFDDAFNCIICLKILLVESHLSNSIQRVRLKNYLTFEGRDLSSRFISVR